MANTLTNLIPILYAAANKVSRDLTGMIPAVMLDAKSEQVAKDQIINVPIVGAATAYDITPGTSPADNGDVTPGNTTMTITKSRYSPVRWNGEEQKAVAHTGIYSQVHVDRIAQAIRTLTNEVELDLTTEGYENSTGAFGTVATVPFTTDLTEASYIRKALVDRGCPDTDLQLVIDTLSGAELRALGQLTKANEAGTTSMRETSGLLDVYGMKIRESAKIQSHTAGTAASATTDATGYAIGVTTITLASAGTGTFITEDVVSFAGDSNKYTIATGDTDVSDGGTIVLKEGLLKAIPAGATAITLVATHNANLAFDRNAIALLARAPEMPEGGDSADDVINITDPFSGLTFQAALYRQYRQTKLEIGLAWGVKAIAPRHIARLYY
ncbi:P22 coat - protein 5 family protein [Candidatus Pacearchaeota archaeon]|nr:P22 coat - protein 5 family protein [Candidatus Pacearchaeota archaeon]